jgi:5-methylcytosine-specific restriction enzyme subunit McrC
MRRSFTIQEWVPAPLPLTNADIRALAALPKHQVSLLPAAGGLWTVTVPNHAGVLALPTCDLFIKPKIDSVGVLAHMLESAFELLQLKKGVALLSDDAQVPHAVLVAAFFRALEIVVARGLKPGYVLSSDAELRVVRGRVDLVQQVRRNLTRRDRIACRFEEFTPDIVENQILRTALNASLRMPLLPAHLHQQGRALVRRFQNVSALSAREALSKPVVYRRNNTWYRQSHDLARAILRDLRPGFGTGKLSGASFILNMFELWERFVGRWLLKHATDSGNRNVEIRLQRKFVYSPPSVYVPDVPGKPDIVYVQRDQPPVVIDTKYKDPQNSAINSADVAQLIAYCARLGAKRGILVYPAAGPQSTIRYPIINTDILIEVHFVYVGGGNAELESSMSRFAGEISRL